VQSRAERRDDSADPASAPPEARSGVRSTTLPPSPPAARASVLLAWALDRDGRRAFVGDLDPARRRERAPFRCIGCGDELVPRLGASRARHFGHRPGSVCALVRPETALHLNAKERLVALCAMAFAGERRVTVLARCPGCRREAPLDLGAAGDAAVPEGVAGARRCDVLVTRLGVAALALEVKVSHAVDTAKEAALAALGVPAVEIDAREEWEREDEDGVSVVPARSLGFARCPSCETQRRADADRERGGDDAELAELESYRARGLLGARPGPPQPSVLPLSRADVAALGFRCPECGGNGVSLSRRVARHACPGAEARPVAWRGYDGATVVLAWWRR
jgi:hypothetical protein